MDEDRQGERRGGDGEIGEVILVAAVFRDAGGILERDGRAGRGGGRTWREDRDAPVE